MQNPIITTTDEIKLGDIITETPDWSDEPREGEVIAIEEDYDRAGYWLRLGTAGDPWSLFVRSGDDILVERPA